ncbi:MAG: YitT family protein [Bacteroidota bacterium]|nr:YitT family protein [Bacteroidota bacterium]
MIKDGVLMIAGVIMAGFALKGFLVPNHFFDGGVTGISLLLHELYHLNLAIVIMLMNLPFVVISFFSVGRRFAIRTFISVILLAISLWLLPDIALTSDKLLISIFGGVILGIGVGLVMRFGAALDGIEVLALYTLKRTSFTITEIILGINILIFSIAAFKFGIETSLYSILTYFAVTRSIDYVVEGIQAYTGITIISGKSEMIKYQLVNTLGRGITVYKGERGFLPGKFEVSTECDIIFTVITRLELRKLKNLVYELDPQAFVFVYTIKETLGGVLKRRHGH